MAKEDIITIALTIIALLITLIAPLPFPEEQRLLIISIVFLVFISIILSNSNKKLDKQEIKQRIEIKKIIDKQKRLEEKLNIHQQLVDIKADIKNLQRGKK